MSSSKTGPDGAQAIARAAAYLKVGVRSVRELRDFLERRGADPQAIDQAVEHFTRKGGLDDRACARLWAGHWARQGYAWTAIREKLAEKSLPEEAIEHAADAIQSEGDDNARARELVRQRRGKTALPRDSARLARLLASRGFDQDVIEQVLETPADFGTQDGSAIE